MTTTTTPITRLALLLVCAVLAVLPFALIWSRGPSHARFDPSVPALSVTPTAATVAAAGGSLALSLRIGVLDPVRSECELLITNIRPLGAFATSPGSLFLNNDTYLFVNARQVMFPALIPAGDTKITLPLTDGNLAHYPFDAHTLRLTMYAMTSTMLARARDLGPGVRLVPLQIAVGKRSGWSVSAAALATGSTGGGTGLGDAGGAEIAVRLRRKGEAIWFAVAAAVATWAAVGAVAAVGIVAVVSRVDLSPLVLVAHTLLLASLPTVRRSLAQAPPLGLPLADAFAFYPPLYVLAASLLMLTSYGFLRHRTDDKQRRARAAKRAVYEAAGMGKAPIAAAVAPAMAAPPVLPALPAAMGTMSMDSPIVAGSTVPPPTSSTWAGATVADLGDMHMIHSGSRENDPPPTAMPVGFDTEEQQQQQRRRRVSSSASSKPVANRGMTGQL